MASFGAPGKKRASERVAAPPEWDEAAVRREITQSVKEDLRPTLREELKKDKALREEIKKEVLKEFRDAAPTVQNRKRVRDALLELEIDATVQATVASEYAERARLLRNRCRMVGYSLAMALMIGFFPFFHWLEGRGLSWMMAIPWVATFLIALLATPIRESDFEKKANRLFSLASEYMQLVQELKTSLIEVDTVLTVDQLRSFLSSRRGDKARVDNKFAPSAEDVYRARLRVDERRVVETDTAAFLRVAEIASEETPEHEEVWDPSLTNFTVKGKK